VKSDLNQPKGLNFQFPILIHGNPWLWFSLVYSLTYVVYA